MKSRGLSGSIHQRGAGGKGGGGREDRTVTWFRPAISIGRGQNLRQIQTEWATQKSMRRRHATRDLIHFIQRRDALYWLVAFSSSVSGVSGIGPIWLPLFCPPPTPRFTPPSWDYIAVVIILLIHVFIIPLYQVWRINLLRFLGVGGGW